VNRDFSFNQASTRVVVEQAFGLLKGRFRVLHGLRVNLEHTTEITVACCVLHNLCIQAGDLWHEPENLPTPTHDGSADPLRGHSAGTVPRASTVAPDPYMTSRLGTSWPEWMRDPTDAHERPERCESHVPEQSDLPPPDFANEKPLQERVREYKTGCVKLREALREYVQTCPKCRRFGGRQ